MVRTVSKEDYLLARGANPRTGIVTPGIRSASSSYDEVEVLKSRGLLPPQKWRQRGDQWISLATDQSTPMESPPPESRKLKGDAPLGKSVRTPVARVNQKAHDSNAAIGLNPSRVTARLSASELGSIPGTFPVTPQQDASTSPLRNGLNSDPRIRRKPVGQTQDRYSVETPQGHGVPRKQRMPEESDETVIRRPFAIQQTRASSAPTSHVLEYFSPNDVGKDLPSLPGEVQHAAHEGQHDDSNSRSFLGHPTHPPAKGRVDWVEDIPANRLTITSRNESGRHVQQHQGIPTGSRKDLPSLPMSSGQSQLPHPDQRRQKRWPRTFDVVGRPPGEPSQMSESQSRKALGPRGGNPRYPYVRPARPARLNRMNYQTHCEEEGPIMRRHPATSLSSHPNPVRWGRTLGPRMMREPRDGTQGTGQTRTESDVFTSPPIISTTYMNTNTHIPTSTSSREMNGPRQNAAFPTRGQEVFWNVETSRQWDRIPRQQPRVLHTLHNLGLHTDTRQTVAMDQARPRRDSRPSMPDRAGCTNAIPKVRPSDPERISIAPQQSMEEISTGAMPEHHHWSLTGTGKINNEHQIQANREQSPEKIMNLYRSQETSERPFEGSPIPISGSPRGRRPEDMHAVRANTRSPPRNGLTNHRNHCETGLADVQQRNINGATHTYEMRPPQDFGDVLVEPTQAPTNERSDLRQLGNPPPPSAAPRRTKDGEKDLRDHTICCPECCREQDCHEGCLGHPSPAPSPTRSCADSDLSSTTTLAAGSGYRSSVEIDDRSRRDILRPTCRDQSPTGRHRMFRALFANDKENSPQTPSSPGAALESPNTFWGGDGAGGVKGAVAAAKRAMGFNHDGNEIVVRKRRQYQRSATALLMPLKASKEAGRGNILPQHPALPNDARRVTSGPKLLFPSGSKSRNVSGASLLTIDIPAFGSFGIGTVWEMILVPLEAGIMWWRNHPEVRTWLLMGATKAADMARTVGDTSIRVWWVGRVYGKTGKLSFGTGTGGKKNGDGMAVLLWDVFRSTGYAAIFLVVALLLARVVGVVVWVLGIGVGILRVVGWCLRWVFGVV